MSLAETIVSKCFSKGVVLDLNEAGKLSAFGMLPPDWVTLVAGWVEHRDLVADYLKQPTAEHARNIRSVLIAQAKFRLNVVDNIFRRIQPGQPAKVALCK